MNYDSLAKARAARNPAMRRKRLALEITALQAATLERARKQLPTSEAAFRKAYSGTSPAAAIKAKCIECCCMQRNEVARCAIEGCPLWPYKPFKDAVPAGKLQQDGAV